MHTPVLLLLFNRPEHAAAALDRIRSVQPERLYVHADGPRPDRVGEAELVTQTREVLQQIDWPCTVHTLLRDTNWGLRKGVSDALNWFFAQEEQGIVVEDDCLPDPSFFAFCEDLLDRYAHDPRVMHIAGSNLAERYTEHLDSSFVWSKFSLVWGWASWRRAWQKMSLDFDGLDDFAEHDLPKFLPGNPLAQAYLLDKFCVTRAGRNQSWAYAWFYSILKHNGLCIVPARNLIQNVGVGTAGATNTTGDDPRARLRARAMPFPLALPSKMEPIPVIETQLFYHTQKRRSRLWLWYLLHQLGLR